LVTDYVAEEVCLAVFVFGFNLFEARAYFVGTDFEEFGTFPLGAFGVLEEAPESVVIVYGTVLIACALAAEGFDTGIGEADPAVVC
jgi:hypothetical protein